MKKTKKDGNAQSYYYRAAFRKLEETGRNSWNWSAFLFGAMWALYRKMYTYTAMVLAISTVVVYFSIMFFELADAMIIISSMNLIIAFFFGFFGNSLYYKLLKHRVSKGYHLVSEYSPTNLLAVFIPSLGLIIASGYDYLIWKTSDTRKATEKANEDIDNNSEKSVSDGPTITDVMAILLRKPKNLQRIVMVTIFFCTVIVIAEMSMRKQLINQIQEQVSVV